MQKQKMPQLVASLTLLIIILINLLFQGFGAETDTITSKFSVKDPDTIISTGKVFKLGFYSPQNTTNRYLAIYYVVSEKTVAWIANRDNPLTDSSGTVTLSKDNGNLVLVNGKNETIWSTNVTANISTNNTIARLLDSGNLILYDNSTGFTIWDSFSHPSNVYLPGLGLIDNTNTGEKVLLSSWRNDTDPGTGIFTIGIQASKIPQVIVWKTGKPHFRSGPWNGLIFIGMTVMYRTVYRNGARLTEYPDGVFNLTLSPENILTQATMTTSGTLERSMWNDGRQGWDVLWDQPENDCDIYRKCGPFGICDMKTSPICSCLRGFEPANKDEWFSGNWTGGCVRRTPLQCSRNNNTNGDGFLKMSFVKVPDFAEPFALSQIEECRARCLNNCSCIAYAHDSRDIGCMFWWERDGLIDTQQFPGYGVDLYIRLENSELDDQNDRRRLYIIIPVTVGLFSILVLLLIACCWKLNRKGRRIKDKKYSKTTKRFPLDPAAFLFKDQSKRDITKELKFFKFETLANATNQFHENNMLGKGGFGHVYKGKLASGKEVAVKRLSEASQQGTEEFTNEVILISKLQHKNLVKLLGCCIEKEERMLIYEYMPNKSLDICLFEPTYPSRVTLDWKKRFNIIEGIGRGLQYLHRDSRLRIIHRDLKPSNILLDEEWNPKISDFGMAKIFRDNQEQGNTARIVGTHGYMAPEYALEGKFSEKSDVYSFGILMLEIVSRQKNTHYHNDTLTLNLLGCAWKFWNEESVVAFADQNIWNLSSIEEIVRCVHVALLCVQEFAEDRPTIRTVLSMLNREILDLPVPKQPLLAKKLDESRSINQLTVTILDGR